MDNYYQILGIENYCNDQEKIKKAYRTQVKFFHPDSNNVSKEMSDIKTKQLNIAYDFLSDPKKKKIYDQELHMVLEGKTSTQSTSNNEKQQETSFTRNKYVNVNDPDDYAKIYFNWLAIIIVVLFGSLLLFGNHSSEENGEIITLALGMIFMGLVFYPGTHELYRVKKQSKGVYYFNGKTPNLNANISDITITLAGNKGNRSYRMRILFDDGYVYIKVVKPDNSQWHFTYSTVSLSPEAQMAVINEAIEKHKEYCLKNAKQANDNLNKENYSNNNKTFDQENINKEESQKKEEKYSKNNKEKNTKTTNKDVFKFCRYCGNRLNDNEMYCRKCGKKVN